MMLRIGVDQSTSSVDFFGIEIVGDCAIVVKFTSDGGSQWLHAAVCVESKLYNLTLTLSAAEGNTHELHKWSISW